MEADGAAADRRPLKSRGTAWAAVAARAALATGISADGVSIVGSSFPCRVGGLVTALRPRGIS